MAFLSHGEEMGLFNGSNQKTPIIGWVVMTIPVTGWEDGTLEMAVGQNSDYCVRVVITIYDLGNHIILLNIIKCLNI